MDLNLTPDYIESILLKIFWTSYEYRAFFAEYFKNGYFENKNVSLILNILVSYYKKYGNIPSEDVTRNIIKAVSDKNNMEECAVQSTLTNALNISESSIESEDFKKDLVINFFKSKFIFSSIMSNLPVIQQEKDVSRCLADFQKISSMSLDKDLGLDLLSPKGVERRLEAYKNPENKLPTMWSTFDRKTHGGVLKDGKCLIVFMGQPGIGKSLILSNLAVNFAVQGKFSIIISLEISEFLYGQRIDAHITGDDINEIPRKPEIVKEKIKTFYTLHPDGKITVKEFPPDSVNANHIKAYVESVINSCGRKPDVLLIDYLNLLKSCVKTEGSYERVGNISRELRKLSYVFECPVITATQPNRGGYDNSDISMENVSESAGISHTADYFSALFQREGDREANKMNEKILKNRLGGRVGDINEYHINYSSLKITDYSSSVVSCDDDEETPDGILSDISKA